jgi:hypothetical protein
VASIRRELIQQYTCIASLSCEVTNCNTAECMFCAVAHSFTHTMSFPCRALRACLSNLIYTVRQCFIHTCHAAPVPCHDHAVLKATSQSHGAAWTRHGMCELASAVQRRHVGDVPAFGFFRLPHGVPRTLLSEAYQSVKL